MFDLMLEKRIQAALTELDHNLWLDKEWSPFGYVYYVVKTRIANDVEPLNVVEWRMDNQPLPLSYDIVNQVRYQEGNIQEAIKEATVNNAVLKEKKRQDVQKDIENVVSDHQFHNHGFKVGDATPRKTRRVPKMN